MVELTGVEIPRSNSLQRFHDVTLNGADLPRASEGLLRIHVVSLDAVEHPRAKLFGVIRVNYALFSAQVKKADFHLFSGDIKFCAAWSDFSGNVKEVVSIGRFEQCVREPERPDLAGMSGDFVVGDQKPPSFCSLNSDVQLAGAGQGPALVALFGDVQEDLVQARYVFNQNVVSLSKWFYDFFAEVANTEKTAYDFSADIKSVETALFESTVTNSLRTTYNFSGGVLGMQKFTGSFDCTITENSGVIRTSYLMDGTVYNTTPVELKTMFPPRGSELFTIPIVRMNTMFPPRGRLPYAIDIEQRVDFSGLVMSAIRYNFTGQVKWFQSYDFDGNIKAKVGIAAFDGWVVTETTRLRSISADVQAMVGVSPALINIVGDILTPPKPLIALTILTTDVLRPSNGMALAGFHFDAIQPPPHDSYDFDCTIIGTSKTLYSFSANIMETSRYDFSGTISGGGVTSYPFEGNIKEVIRYPFEAVVKNGYRYLFDGNVQEYPQTRWSYLFEQNILFDNYLKAYGEFSGNVVGCISYPFEVAVEYVRPTYGFEGSVSSLYRRAYPLEGFILKNWVPCYVSVQASPTSVSTPTRIPPSAVRYRLLVYIYAGDVLLATGSCNFKWTGPGYASVSYAISNIPVLLGLDPIRVVVSQNSVIVVDETRPTPPQGTFTSYYS